MKLPLFIAGGLLLLLIAARAEAQDSVEQEASGKCAYLGFHKGEAEFEECRERSEGEIRQRRYEETIYAQQQAYFNPSAHRETNDSYYNEDDQLCQKTHRGWVICK